LIVATATGWAAQDQAAAPSTEQRAKMAAAHEKMAACLRSSKDIADCRAEMQHTCQALGPHGCGLMGKGMGMGAGMRPDPPEKTPPNQ
jgi:hypothetical protein